MADTDIAVKTQVKLKQPTLFKVVLHNDDYTPMDFVIAILIQIFGKDTKEAEAIMLDVHKRGRGVAGVYAYEVASQKKTDTEGFARQFGHPLRMTLEPE
jgi:ATP-dependent Clp protease adaptor protein ClpS